MTNKRLGKEMAAAAAAAANEHRGRRQLALYRKFYQEAQRQLQAEDYLDRQRAASHTDYCTTYEEIHCRPGFEPALEREMREGAALAELYPLDGSEPVKSLWYCQQPAARRRVSPWHVASEPFRRTSAFTTPTHLSLHESPVEQQQQQQQHAPRRARVNLMDQLQMRGWLAPAFLLGQERPQPQRYPLADVFVDVAGIMQRPKEKNCIGPTPDEVAKCSASYETPSPPVRRVRRCLRADQVAGDAEDRRFTNTKWILNSDGPTEPGHFVTSNQHFFAEPAVCPQSGARRARLLWHYLLHRHALRINQEAVAAPEIEPYVTEYSTCYSKDFEPALVAELTKEPAAVREEDAKHPLYEDPPCSYWYQKQMLPPRGTCWDGVTSRGEHDRLQPFRRNALFTTPVHLTLYDDPAENTPFRPPRFIRRVDHRVQAPYDTRFQ